MHYFPRLLTGIILFLASAALYFVTSISAPNSLHTMFEARDPPDRQPEIDDVLTYDFGFDRMQHIRNMEQTGGVIETGIFEYASLLNECVDQSTPYIAILEDDTVAMDGWYHRTMTTIHESEQLAALRRAKARLSLPSPLLLRTVSGLSHQQRESYCGDRYCSPLFPPPCWFLFVYSNHDRNPHDAHDIAVH
jgi:hypothetical protein